MNIEDFNAEYGIGNELRFIAGEGGLVMARVQTGAVEALVSVYAGQVLQYRPKGQSEDVMFLSDKAYYSEGKAIKGGIPVCWPWFGADPDGKGRPGHGFVRNRMWELRATEITDDNRVRLIMGLQDSDETCALWPHKFDLLLDVSIGETLQVALMTANMGDTPMRITQALHSYFRVGDIAKVQLTGLEERTYLDKASIASVPEVVQAGPVVIAQEVDRIYLDTKGSCTITDEALGRSISVESDNSRATVVWNPWQDIAASMGDLEDDDYHRFVCVETANAVSDSIDIPPGELHRMSVEISVT